MKEERITPEVDTTNMRVVSPSIHFLLWCKTSFPFSPIEDSNKHLVELCKDFTYWVQNRIGFAVPIKVIDFDLEYLKAKVSAVTHEEEGWILIKEIYSSESEADR